MFKTLLMIAMITLAFAVSSTEARLGRKRNLTPAATQEEETTSTGAAAVAITEVVEEIAKYDCNVPCALPGAGVGSISVCHTRGGDRIEICTEPEEFEILKQNGGTCGYCPIADERLR